ncbi:MAG TPA: ATP-binding cassette domain-containing protein, partial [Patescibacteria group bacterium]|nr:ATP-binding cassette domain-containing protein [Patescibacteria group bacterium]
MEIKEGELFSFVGPSGGGKSTILKLIAKIESPTSGEITAPDNIGMVFQLGALFPWLTAIDNVMFPLKMKGVSNFKSREEAKKELELVNLTGFENKYPRE